MDHPVNKYYGDIIHWTLLVMLVGIMKRVKLLIFRDESLVQ